MSSSDDVNPLVRDFGEAGKSSVRAEATSKVGKESFRTTQWSEGDTKFTYRTKGGMPEVTAERDTGSGGERSREVFIGSVVSSLHRWGFKADGSPMAVGTESEAGSALFILKEAGVDTKKNKARVLNGTGRRIKPGAKLDHPGNAYWVGGTGKIVSWWRPRPGRRVKPEEATTPGVSIPSLDPDISGWLGMGELCSNGNLSNWTYATAGTPLWEGRVYVDGELFHKFNQIVLAAAIYTDGANKFLRVLTSGTSTFGMAESVPTLKNITMRQINMATKEVTAHGVVSGAEYDLRRFNNTNAFDPAFNGSGTKFVVKSPVASECVFGNQSPAPIPPPSAPNCAAEIAQAEALLTPMGSITRADSPTAIAAWYVGDDLKVLWHWQGKSSVHGLVELPGYEGASYRVYTGGRGAFFWSRLLLNNTDITGGSFGFSGYTEIFAAPGTPYDGSGNLTQKVTLTTHGATDGYPSSAGSEYVGYRIAVRGVICYGQANGIVAYAAPRNISASPITVEITRTLSGYDISTNYLSPVISNGVPYTVFVLDSAAAEPSAEALCNLDNPSAASSADGYGSLAVGKNRNSAVFSYGRPGVFGTWGEGDYGHVVPVTKLFTMKNGTWSDVSSELGEGLFAVGLIPGRFVVRT